MCGLAGVLDVGDMTSEEIVRQMNAAIAHRGPDDFGTWSDLDAGIVLGHRRLAIVDLSAAGHQPMRSSSGRYVLVFNGEVYNHLDLRADLEALGKAPPWRGHSDTETLLAGFEAWGLEDTLARSTGMFAMALWDRATRELKLARDRLGEKPLYYSWQGKGDRATFLFGSELKSLRAHPAFNAPISRGAVALYLQHNYIPAPWTIYDGVSKLEPGSVLTVSRERRTPRTTSYWDFCAIANRAQARPFEGTAEEAVDRVEALARKVIRRQMVADVPLGAFLSGGIDSSVVVSLMQAESSRRVKTFTIGFGEAEFNEAAHAKRVAEHLGTDHTELYLSARQALDVIPLLPSMYCEPFADSSQIPTFLVSQLARRHVTVSLSGDAGDELFGGYSRYASTLQRWQSLRRFPSVLRTSTARLIGGLAGSAAALHLNRQLSMRLERAAPIGASASLDALYVQEISHVRPPGPWVPGAPALRSAFETTPGEFSAFPPLTRLMALDTLTYLPDDILVKVDRAAMAVSLETRVPFLDHDFVELAWSLPIDIKVRDGVTKWPLRQILYRHVPREIVDRPKMGFGVPVARWLRGELRDWAESLLDERLLAAQGYFDVPRVRELWRQHLAGTADWSFQLWNVLMFQAWLDTSNMPRAA